MKSNLRASTMISTTLRAGWMPSKEGLLEMNESGTFIMKNPCVNVRMERRRSTKKAKKTMRILVNGCISRSGKFVCLFAGWQTDFPLG